MNSQEIWQIEVNNQIYEASFEEMCQWIADSDLLPTDKVRRGNLRWIEAGKVPFLQRFFTAKELGISCEVPVLESSAKAKPNIEPPVVTETPVLPPVVNQSNVSENSNKFPTEPRTTAAVSSNGEIQNDCSLHAEIPAKYFCEKCSKSYCKSCPNSFGSNVKICPICGALCKPIEEAQTRQQKNFQYHHADSAGIDSSDFTNALAYPFKFKASLLIGSLMYMFLALVQTTLGASGYFMTVLGIVCVILTNSLTFGILANTIRNFSRGDMSRDFMRKFEDFNFGSDVVKTFFLGVGVFLSSFGTFFLVLVVGFFLLWNVATPPKKISKNSMPNAPTVTLTEGADGKPKIVKIEPPAAGSATQNGTATQTALNLRFKDSKSYQYLNEQNQELEAGQLPTATGEASAAERIESEKLASRYNKISMPLLLLAGLTLLWAVFYLPAACLVAGYTNSIRSALNPLVGLNMIRRLRTDYSKILAISILFGILTIIVTLFLNKIFASFDKPMLDNVPATVLKSVFTFYFWIVFSAVLGAAAYKNHRNLSFFRA